MFFCNSIYMVTALSNAETESQLRQLHQDFGNSPFRSRNNEIFDRLSELGYLTRAPLGSNPHDPVEYRLKPDVIESISSNFRWEERPYTYAGPTNRRQSLFEPYKLEFVSLFSGNVFTYMEFSQFLDYKGIEMPNPASFLSELFGGGFLKRRRLYVNGNSRYEYVIIEKAFGG